MENCKKCSGGCDSCGGCGKQLELSAQEVRFLEKLAQIPFLPVARKREDMVPVYLEDEDCAPEEYSLILQCLETKMLISIDYDAPLKGADMSAYAQWPVHGSIALTARGQQVLELLELQGAQI